MSKSTIPLAKGYDPAKLNFPVYVSKKEDGVPVKITISKKTNDNFGKMYDVVAETRQGKPVPSLGDDLDTILRVFTQKADLNRTLTLVCEITHEELVNFKDISGLVRKQTPQEGFIYSFFDLSFDNEATFADRTSKLEWFLADSFTDRVKYIKQVRCDDEHQLKAHVDSQLTLNPRWEGLVARSHDATFKPNSRHWDYQKIVIDPTIDLRIIGMEEAIDKHGEPKGMVGRLVAKYKGNRIGIGPGKLTHKERTDLWKHWETYVQPYQSDETEFPNEIATIKYKRDASYEALRQPTFQHWRPEKTEESYE